MVLVNCNLGNFLVFPTFVKRCLYVCKDAREPNGKKWNYLSNVCSEMNAYSIYVNIYCHKPTTSD